MFLPLPMAAPDPVTWTGVVLGIVGSSTVGGILLAVFQRYGKDRDDATAADLTLAGLNLSTLKEAREQWRKDIHDERLRYQAELAVLTNKLEELQEDNANLKATHVEMYMAIRSNQEFFDMLKGRAKDGVITFRMDELPAHIDLTEISPTKAFRRASKTQTQQINLNVLPPPKS